jgi:maleate isomerase
MRRDASILNPDGFGWRARIGVLTHDDNTVSETEFWTMVPDGVSVHAARVPFTDQRTFADPPGFDDATGRLARLPLQAIVVAWTWGSYILGTTGEQELVARLERRSNGIPVFMPAAAAAAAFRELGVGRIALFHGPWFTDEVDQKGVEYFENRGFEVVHVSHLMPETEIPHPNLGSVARPDELYEWVRSHAPANLEGVFIAGNGVRAIGVIAALEEQLGRPVLTANQVALWYVLRLAGVRAKIDDYGQVFAKLMATSQGLEQQLRGDGAALATVTGRRCG